GAPGVVVMSGVVMGARASLSSQGERLSPLHPKDGSDEGQANYPAGRLCRSWRAGVSARRPFPELARSPSRLNGAVGVLRGEVAMSHQLLAIHTQSRLILFKGLVTLRHCPARVAGGLALLGGAREGDVRAGQAGEHPLGTNITAAQVPSRVGR